MRRDWELGIRDGEIDHEDTKNTKKKSRRQRRFQTLIGL
jgi:hypothetical protein